MISLSTQTQQQLCVSLSLCLSLFLVCQCMISNNTRAYVSQHILAVFEHISSVLRSSEYVFISACGRQHAVSCQREREIGNPAMLYATQCMWHVFVDGLGVLWVAEHEAYAFMGMRARTRCLSPTDRTMRHIVARQAARVNEDEERVRTKGTHAKDACHTCTHALHIHMYYTNYQHIQNTSTGLRVYECLRWEIFAFHLHARLCMYLQFARVIYYFNI